MNCLITEARRRAAAIKLAQPTHTCALTKVGHNHGTVMKSIRRFGQHLDRRYGCPVKLCGSIETTPTGHVHAHAFLYVTGTLDALKLDMDFVAAVEGAGLGDCMISRIGHDDWSDYAGELAEARAEIEMSATFAAYPTKSLVVEDLRGPFLELNRRGDKYGIGFQSNGFFRDGPDGEHLTERQAKQRAYVRAQERRGGQGGIDNDGEADGEDDWGHGEAEGPMDVDEADLIAELTFIRLTGGVAAPAWCGPRANAEPPESAHEPRLSGSATRPPRSGLRASGKFRTAGGWTRVGYDSQEGSSDGGAG